MWKLELSELQPLWIHRYRCEARVPRRPYRVGRLGWRDKLTLWRCKSDIRHFFTIVGDFSPQGQNSQRQNSKKPIQARLLQLSSNVSHGQMNLISCSPTDGIVTCLLNRVISSDVNLREPKHFQRYRCRPKYRAWCSLNLLNKIIISTDLATVCWIHPPSSNRSCILSSSQKLGDEKFPGTSPQVI